MKALLLKYWDDILNSYWFIPSLMTIGAVLLAFLMTTLDNRLEIAWLDQIGWLHANKAEGARILLSTVAGSMITVAGVTFSITIASVVYASSQFGPRLLTNFMQDQGNQVTLGTFIATFLYCLLVLRTVRSASEASENALGDLAGAFVPQLAILCGLLLTLASLGVFIFFIHHVPESMHVSNVVAGIGRELHDKVEDLFPASLESAKSADAPEALPKGFYEKAVRIRSDGSGYIQTLDAKGLLDTATKQDLLLRVGYRPGDFIMEGQALMMVWPPESVTEQLHEQLRKAFARGGNRTQTQNLMFLVDELVEVATRALSPGINDPFTAISCMDWLSSALAHLGGRPLPSAFWYDQDGVLRLVLQPVTFAVFARAFYDQLRPYASADRNAALHMMKTLGEVGRSLDNADYRALLLSHAQKLVGASHAVPLHQHDLDLLDERLSVVTHLLSGKADAEETAYELPWLGGSS